MVMNGGLNSTIANNPQFPRLNPSPFPGQSAQPGPSPFLLPPLPFTPPKSDTLSLSSAASASNPNLGASLNKPFPPLLPFGPLPGASASFPALPAPGANRPGLPALNAPSLSSTPSTPSSPLTSNSASTSETSLPSAVSSATQAGKADLGSGIGTLGDAAKPAASAAANGAFPGVANGMTPAETGQKVGELVTKLLEEVPALQKQIEHIDWESLSQEEIMPKLEKLRISVQPSIKHIPKFVDRKIGRLFEDPQSQKLAGQFFEWLRKEPDPETLAALQAEKHRPSSAEGEDFDEMDRPTAHRPPRHSNEDDFAEDDSFSSDENKSFFGKWKTKAQDAYSSIKDKIFSRGSKSEGKSASHGHSGGRRLRDDDLSDYGSEDDLDLESLLRPSHASSSEDFGPVSHKRRPMRDDY